MFFNPCVAFYFLFYVQPFHESMGKDKFGMETEEMSQT